MNGDTPPAVTFDPDAEGRPVRVRIGTAIRDATLLDLTMPVGRLASSEELQALVERYELELPAGQRHSMQQRARWTLLLGTLRMFHGRPSRTVMARRRAASKVAKQSRKKNRRR